MRREIEGQTWSEAAYICLELRSEEAVETFLHEQEEFAEGSSWIWCLMAELANVTTSFRHELTLSSSLPPIGHPFTHGRPYPIGFYASALPPGRPRLAGHLDLSVPPEIASPVRPLERRARMDAPRRDRALSPILLLL